MEQTVYRKSAFYRDICGICGKEIRRGSIFVVRLIERPRGRGCWKPCHLRCWAQYRDRAQDAQVGAALPLPPGHVLGKG